MDIYTHSCDSEILFSEIILDFSIPIFLTTNSYF